MPKMLKNSTIIDWPEAT